LWRTIKRMLTYFRRGGELRLELAQTAYSSSGRCAIGLFTNPEEITMPNVYALFQFSVDDADGFRRYTQSAAPTVAAHGGRVVVASATTDVREGDLGGGFTTIVEFPSREAAEAWYSSPEYQSASILRHQTTSNGSLVIMDEFVPPSAAGGAR
jgi:uncharacterized protein (DUF1330 family)